MKKPIRLALPIAFAALLAGCTHAVEMKMAVDVLSEPEKATVSYKGKVLGETPRSLNVKTFEDDLVDHRGAAPISRSSKSASASSRPIRPRSSSAWARGASRPSRRSSA